jgi:hypothetical protein
MLFQSLSAPGGWSCSAPAVGAGGPVSCTAAALTNGSAAQFTLVALLNSVSASPTQIVNSATVTSTTLDPNLAPNNTGSVTITGSDSPVVPGNPQVVATAKLTKLGDGSYQAVVTVTNRGGGSAQNTVLNAASIGSANGTPIPQSIGNIPPGGYGLATVTFPPSAGTSGTLVIEKYSGAYTGGTFTGSLRATLP